MSQHKLAFLGLAFVACLAIKPIMAAPLLCEIKLADAAIPQSAYFLPESQASQLQSALNTYQNVRLKPGGDYTRSLSIKLNSNQGLYGLANTKIPPVFIPEGTSNAILSGVSPGKISFEGFTKPTQANCFNRIRNTRIEAKNALLNNNLFIDLSNIAIDIDTSQKGYLTNNRFIRTMAHATSPAIKIIGDAARQSSNNMFVWTNLLTPKGDSIIVDNQKNISFIGIDAESWNFSNQATLPGMMNVFNTNYLSVFLPEGGDAKQIGQYFNLDAKNIVIQGMRMGPTKKPGIILGNNVSKLLTVNTQNIGLIKSNKATQVIDVYNNLSPSIAFNKITLNPERLPNPIKNAITELLQSDSAMFDSLEKPVFLPIPNPAGPNWQTNLNLKPDSSNAIQSLIDKNGIAELPAGVFYVAKPLLLKNGQGIIGSGSGKTAIIAKSPTIDIIVGATHLNQKVATTSFVLADLTLQGGLNGINHSATGSGIGAQYNLITMSHVTFRNMANAGILINNIYAWDNNFIDHTNFYRCKTGVIQRPNPSYTRGDQMGMTYLDKNVFFQSQFVENNLAIDWPAKRANNLNAFINSQFVNNSLVINQMNSDSTFFANSVFENTSNHSLMLANRITGFVNSYFIGKQSNIAQFDGNVLCNRCKFDNTAPNSEIVVSPNSKNSFFSNTILTKPMNQSMDTGLIINSNFSDNPQKPISNCIFINKTIKHFN